MQHRVIDDGGRGGVEVRTIGQACERKHGVGLCFAREVVCLVEIISFEETMYLRLFNVSDVQIGMQRLFEVQRLVSIVGDREAESELAAEGDLIGDEEVIKSERTAEFGGLEAEGEG